MEGIHITGVQIYHHSSPALLFPFIHPAKNTGESTRLPSSHLQRGDIILSMNDKDLINKTHSEAVQVIKSLAGASFVRMRVILGEESADMVPPPEWKEWVTLAQQKASKGR